MYTPQEMDHFYLTRLLGLPESAGDKEVRVKVEAIMGDRNNQTIERFLAQEQTAKLQAELEIRGAMEDKQYPLCIRHGMATAKMIGWMIHVFWTALKNR